MFHMADKVQYTGSQGMDQGVVNLVYFSVFAVLYQVGTLRYRQVVVGLRQVHCIM